MAMYPSAMPTRRSTPRPFVILAGFLGVGKTTFLRSVVTELVRRGLRPRVILNDLENAGVDGATLRDLQTELAPVSGGCLCCETQDALIEALRTESESPYDVALLETNGTTDTGVLLEILSEAGLDHLGPPMQLTLIDAAKFERRDWMNTIEKEQLRTSSHLKVSKRDLVTPSRFEEVCRAVQSVAPAARFAEATDIADTIAAQLDEQSSPSPLRRPGALIGKTARPPPSPSAHLPVVSDRDPVSDRSGRDGSVLEPAARTGAARQGRPDTPRARGREAQLSMGLGPGGRGLAMHARRPRDDRARRDLRRKRPRRGRAA